MKSYAPLLALVAAVLMPELHGAPSEPTPGEVTTVPCRHDATQTYDCYLPTNFDAEKKWPILYGFSPEGKGSYFVNDYKDVCEKHGWIVVASNNAKNGPWAPIKAAMDAMWKDTQARLPIGDRSCYATGWSGGSGVAFDLASTHPDRFAGVIPIAAGSGWDQYLPKLPRHVAIYFVMGDQDSAEYVKEQAKQLAEKGHRTEVHIFSGGHVWPPKQSLEGGVDWLVKVAIEPSARTRFKDLEILKLRDNLSKRLGMAVRKVQKGDLSGALVSAQKVLGRESASPQEKEDAASIIDAITKRLQELQVLVDQLLEDALPYEASLVLEILKSAQKGDAGKEARKRLKSLSAGREQRQLIEAGKLYNRALEYFEAGDFARGRATMQTVAKKHAGTKYAELAASER